MSIVTKIPVDLRRRVTLLFVGIAAFHAVVILLAVIVSRSYPLFLGLIFLAYGFGLRHAVDADHIIAIDNTTRKLIHEGKRPISVGFFFSLGHSTIVIVLSAVIALGTAYVHTNLPKLREAGSLIGTSVSSAFLIIIGIINLIVLIDIIKVWRKSSKGKKYDEQLLDTHLGDRGFFARLLKPLLLLVQKSWHMYFIGFLFGLGFDTATEIGLLSISAASALNGVSMWEILLLPLAFTAGMTLIDTLDGVLMLGAYSWAYVDPLRKLYYNMNITLVSVVIALFIGGVEALQIMSSKLGFHGALFRFADQIALGNMGFFIIAAFLLSWAISAMLYRMVHFKPTI